MAEKWESGARNSWTRRPRRNNRQQQQRSNENAHAQPMQTNQNEDLPGFYWDTDRNRYFRIVCETNATGVSGAISNASLKERDAARIAANIAKQCCGTKHKHTNSIDHCVRIVANRQRGNIPTSTLNRIILHNKMLTMPPLHKPSPLSVTLGSGRQSSTRCDGGMTVEKGGIVGCWSVVENHGHTSTAFKYITFACDRNNNNTIPSIKHEKDICTLYNDTPNHMNIARVDSDVTCLLYSTEACGSLRGSRVCMCPIVELSAGPQEFVDSHVYNVNWTMHNAMNVTAVAFNAPKMSIGIATDTHAVVVDVIARKDYRVSTMKRRTLAIAFGDGGNMMYLGRDRDTLMGCDLRLRKHICQMQLAVKSAYNISLMPDPNYLLTAAYGNSLRLWDVRQRKCVIEYEGHVNSHYKLHCQVDHTDQILLAVGSDGIARCWSLNRGNLLCEVPPPIAVNTKSHIPTVLYVNHMDDGPALIQMLMNNIYYVPI